MLSFRQDTLYQRSMALEEHQAAVKTTISKRRQIERLKASSNIRPERVDEAVEELKEVCRFCSPVILVLIQAVRPRKLKKSSQSECRESQRTFTRRSLLTLVILMKMLLPASLNTPGHL